MNEFTPGPWQYLSGSHGVYSTSVPEKAIALVYGTREAPDEFRDANARLIAAAPDLLDALRAVLYKYAGNGETDDGDMRAFNEAHAAIAKATGEQS